MRYLIKPILALALILMITGCGGGSNSPGPSNPPGSGIEKIEIAGYNEYSYQAVDGYGEAARFRMPKGITIDKKTGILYVTDHECIRRLTPTANGYYVKTIADANDGFNNPSGIAVGPDDCIYIADPGNHTIRRLRWDKINDIYTVELVAGSVDTPGYQDNDQDLKATVLFNDPTGIVCDPKLGTDPSPPVTLYVTDWGNNVIRKVVPFSTTVVSTIAGTAGPSTSIRDGVGGDAKFSRPWGITIDNDGYLYVTDNEKIIRQLFISKDVPDKYEVKTIYNLEGYFKPKGITANNSGLYISRWVDGKVQKITNNNGMDYAANTILTESLNFLDGITSDDEGNLYVVNYSTYIILKISIR
jgi:sugar lactone lactonase YvrE